MRVSSIDFAQAVFGIDMSNGKRIDFDANSTLSVRKIAQCQAVEGSGILLVNMGTTLKIVRDGQRRKGLSEIGIDLLQGLLGKVPQALVLL